MTRVSARAVAVASMAGRWLGRLVDALTRAVRSVRAWLAAARTPCPIPWRPNALGPVFYGIEEVGAGAGAPCPLRIYYPSLDGSPDGAPILTSCGRYPLVVLAHGQCLQDAQLPPPHYQRWDILPAQLARAGYVVAVPEVPHGANPSMNDEAVDLLRMLVSWMRTQWTGGSLLASGTGLVGHSFGAMVGARLAAEGTVAAYASLSGKWQDWDFDGAPLPLPGLDCPKLFVWGAHQLFDQQTEIPAGEWARLSLPKHRAVFGGDFAHWDYLRPGASRCETARGDCRHAGGAAIDLVTMFFGRYLPPSGTPDLPHRIPASLVPPPLVLTPQQQFFAGGFLTAFRAFEEAGDVCEVDIAHETADDLAPLELEPGTLQFGSVPLNTSRTRVLRIRNPNTSGVAVSVPGASGSLFTWATVNRTLAGGEEVSLSVTFRPVSSAIVQTTITVTSGTPASPQSVTAIGKGTGGFPTAEPGVGEPGSPGDRNASPSG